MIDGTSAAGPGTAELHFVGWERPALPLAADLLVDRYRGERSVEMSSVLVVLPGGRAGRRLLELLLERTEALGLPLRPPRITTVGALPEILVPPERPTPAPLLARRAWAQALRELSPEQTRLLVDPAPEPDDLTGWMALAGTVLELEGEVGAGGHDFASVAAACGEGLLFDDRARWEALAEAQAGVRRRLRALGLESRHDHRRRTARPDARDPDAPGFRGDVWLVGVAELPPIVRRIVEGVARLEVVVHAPPTLADAFDALGCVRAPAWRDRPAGLPDGLIRVVGGPRDQAAVLVEELRRLGRQGADDSGELSAESVTLGVPDPEVVPFLEDRLAAEGVRTRRAEGHPVEGTLPFRLLEAVAEYLSEGSWDALAALIRHPDVKGLLEARLPPGVHPAVVADLYHGTHLPRTMAPNRLPAEWRTRKQARGLSLVRDRLRELLLDPLAGRRPLSGWVDPLAELLQAVYGRRELSPQRPGDRAVLKVAEGMREAMDGLASLPPALDEAVEGAAALRLVLDELRGGTVPEPAEEEAVELSGWLELHLDDAPVMVVTGMNEPHLPESRTGDPFVPHALRRRLGLLDNDDRWARDLYRLQAMAASRRGLVLVAGRRNAAGDPLRPSRLLLAEEGMELARRLRWFLGDGEVGDGEVHEGGSPPGGDRPQVEAEVEVRAEAEAKAAADAPAPGTPAAAGNTGAPAELQRDPFALPPEPVIHAKAAPDSLAVTAFRTLLRDPYLFALQRELRLEAADDSARELDPAGFGDLAHRVLQRFGEDALEGGPAAGTDPTALRGLLDELLQHEVRARFGAVALPAVRIQVEQLRSRLHAFADWQGRWAAQGWRIAGVEASPTGPGVRFEVDGAPFHLRGRIDRVDHHPASGRWVLFDYKTSARGGTPEDTHRKRAGRKKDDPMEWVDLQLPLYRHLIRAIQAPGGGGPLVPPEAWDRVEMGFILLPEEVEATGEALAEEWTPADLLEADELARSLVRRLREGRYVWDPETSTIRAGDALAPVVGAGVYRDLDDEGGDDDDVEDRARDDHV